MSVAVGVAPTQDVPSQVGLPDRLQFPQHRDWFGLIERLSVDVTPSQVRLTEQETSVVMGVEFEVFGMTVNLHAGIDALATQEPDTPLDDQLSVVGSPGQTFVTAAFV